MGDSNNNFGSHLGCFERKSVAAQTDNHRYRSDCRYFLAFADEKPIGVIDFTSITKESCEWGYYLAPQMQTSGYGVLLEYYVLKYAFETLGVEKLFCAVLDSNKNVYDTHIKYFGFKADERYSSAKEVDGKAFIFNGLSLTKENWLNWNNPMIQKILKFFKVEKVSFDNS